MASHDDEVIRAMADAKTGIPARSEYLPTLAHIAKFAEEFESRRHAVRDLRQGRVAEPPVRKPYRPYPKLYDAFARESALLAVRSFDTLTEASRRLATQGFDAARDYLLTAKRDDVTKGRAA